MASPAAGRCFFRNRLAPTHGSSSSPQMMSAGVVAALIASVIVKIEGRPAWKPRGHADFYAALARHDAKGSANTMRSFQGKRPSIYTMTDAIRRVPTPALILCGDEDDNCIGPSLFLKQHLPAAGLSFFPKSGHVHNLEEPALFNEMVERFIALVEAGRWPVRDARSMVKVAV